MINSSISEKTYTIALGVLEYAVGFEFSYNPNNTPQLEVMIDGVALDYSSEYLISEDGLDIVLLLLEGEEDNLRLVGSQLDIRRSIPLEQNSDYQVGRIDPKQIEEDLDLAVERDQEIFNKFKYFLGLSNNQRNINLQELNLADDKRLIYFDYPTKTLKTTAFDYTGAFDHSLSLNRNLPHQHLAEAIDFDNGDTTVTDLQTKIESIIGSMAILGETSTTAYRGDRGKTAYDHSQLISGNPHSVTAIEVGLGNVDNTSDANKPISIIQQTALDGKVSTTLVKDPTGFDSPELVTVSYDAVARTVTITTNGAKFYWRGIEVVLGASHTSVAHTDANNTYYYYYNGLGFAWSTTPWTYDLGQLAVVQYQSNYKLGIRECHGLMNYLTHDELHATIGTYLTSGADVTAGSYVLNSSTATNKRPVFGQATIKDEDLPHIIPSVSSGAYCHRYLTSTGIKSYTTDQTDFIIQNGTVPRYNQFTGGVWTSTDFAVNDYGAVFAMAIPVTSDTGSQKYRYLFVQPQQVSGVLTTIQALTPNNLIHGEATSLLSEYVFVGKIIIRRVAGSWQIISIEKLLGSKIQQVSAATGGGYLTQVIHDATLAGDGTAANPLTVIDGGGSSGYPQKFISQSSFSLHPSRKDFSMYGLEAVGAYNAATSSFNFTGVVTEYFTTNMEFAPGASPWEITVAVTPTNFVAPRSIVNSSTTEFSAPYLRFNTTGKLGIFLSSNGSTWNLASNVAGAFTYTAGTKYWIKINFTGTQYIVSYSTDGVNYNIDYSLTSSAALYQANNTLMFGLYSTFTSQMLGSMFMDSISYKIATVEQLSVWNQNNASSLIFEAYSARGTLNTNNINTTAMTKLVNTNWSAGTGNGAFIPYSTYTTFATGRKYSLFMVTNGTLNDIIAISSTAHTNGVLVAGAVTAINTALSTTITDYRYVGECWANDYTTPYLKKYTKQWTNFSVYSSPDNLIWYNMRADNWVEQGGQVPSTGTARPQEPITLPVKMATGKYHKTKQLFKAASLTTGFNWAYMADCQSGVIDTTTTIFLSIPTNAVCNGVNWEVKGYAA